MPWYMTTIYTETHRSYTAYKVEFDSDGEYMFVADFTTSSGMSPIPTDGLYSQTSATADYTSYTVYSQALYGDGIHLEDLPDETVTRTTKRPRSTTKSVSTLTLTETRDSTVLLEPYIFSEGAVISTLSTITSTVESPTATFSNPYWPTTSYSPPVYHSGGISSTGFYIVTIFVPLLIAGLLAAACVSCWINRQRISQTYHRRSGRADYHDPPSADNNQTKWEESSFGRPPTPPRSWRFRSSMSSGPVPQLPPIPGIPNIHRKPVPLVSTDGLRQASQDDIEAQQSPPKIRRHDE